MEEKVPKLLNLIPKERDWIVRDCGVGLAGVQDEKKLELKLGPPRAEDWESNVKKSEDASVLSLSYFPKASKTTKRGFLDTAKSKNEAGNNGNSSEARESKTTSVPVVGWPPIRSFRRNIASSSSKQPILAHNAVSENEKKREICKKGFFVKINMDGIPIGRKVDLKAYDSYDKLSSVVEELFQGLLAAQKDPSTAGAQITAEQKQVFTGLLDGTGEYTLVYEDNEGDRMLVGDVPWEMFVSTAKRLRVLKSSDLSMLTLGATSRKRTSTEC